MSTVSPSIDLTYVPPPADGAGQDSFAERFGEQLDDDQVPLGEIALKSVAVTKPKARPTGFVPLELPSFLDEADAGWLGTLGGDAEEVEEVEEVEAIEVPEGPAPVEHPPELALLQLPEIEEATAGSWLDTLASDEIVFPDADPASVAAPAPEPAPAAPPARPAQPAPAAAPPVAPTAPATPRAPAPRPAAATAATAPAKPRPAPAPRRAPQTLSPGGVPQLAMPLDDIKRLPLTSFHGMVISQCIGDTTVSDIGDILAAFGTSRVLRTLDELVVLGVVAIGPARTYRRRR